MSLRVVLAKPKLYREVIRSLSRKWSHKKVLDTFPAETLELTNYSNNVISSGLGGAKNVSRSDSVFVVKMDCRKKVLDTFSSFRILRKHSN